MKQKNTILFYVNKKKFEISAEKASMTLSDFLRYEIDFPGTKVVCAEGDCGACTVMVGSPISAMDKIKYHTINSCIAPLFLLNGYHIITVEGIAINKRLHPVQEKMIEGHGAQCGYCTPGFIGSLVCAVEDNIGKKEKLTEKEVKNRLTGNLCRCTGYDSIIKAGAQVEIAKCFSLADHYHEVSRNKELIEWRESSVELTSFNVHGDGLKIFIPNSIDELCRLKSKYPDLKITSGATDLGVLVNKGKIKLRHILSLKNIPELFQIKKNNNSVSIGCLVTVHEVEKFYENINSEFSKLLHVFASPQIKNSATLAGNVMNASPIADSVPFLILSDAKVCLVSSKGAREVNINDFYKGYKELNVLPDEIVSTIEVPFVSYEKLKLYKVSLREDLDISAVTFAGGVNLEKGMIKNSKIVYGGVGPTVKRIPEVEKFLNGRSFSKETFSDAGKILEQHIAPISDVRGSKEFRMIVAKNLLDKYFNEVSQ